MFFCRREKETPARNLIFVKDMIVDMQIGAYDNERGRTQKVRINIIVEPETWPDASHDNLNETVSYDVLVNNVFTVSRSGHIHLVETAAEKIADACLKDAPIRKVTVRVEKMEIYPFAIPGVEITKIRA